MTTALPMSAPAGQAQVLQLAADFVTAARMFRAGSAEVALVRLLPLPLAEDELLVRVPLLVAAGLAVTASLGGASVQHLITAVGTDESLVDLLVDLVGLFAALDWGGDR